MDDLEATEEGWADLVDCAGRMKAALEYLQGKPWGPVQGTLGALLARLVKQVWNRIPQGLDEEAKTVAEGNAAYLLVLTNRGRAKLVSLSEAGLGVRDRRDPSSGPAACIGNPGVDGHVAELHAVRRTQMVWLFGTDGQVTALPLRAIDATFDEQPDGITENLGVYLDLSAKWDPFADRVAAACPYDDAPAAVALRPAYEGTVTWIDPAATIAFKVAKVKLGRELAVGSRLSSTSDMDVTIRAVFTDDNGNAMFALRNDGSGQDVLLTDQSLGEVLEDGDLWFADRPTPPTSDGSAATEPPPGTGTEVTQVLLANEYGLAEAVPAGMLPRRPGGRVRLGSPLLTKVRPARWAVPLRPGDDLFVATTKNRVLRLRADTLVSDSRRIIEALTQLDEGERVAALAAMPTGSELSGGIFIVSEGGYGRQVAASEFPYGKVGGKGVVGQKVGKRSGSICTIEPVREGSHLVVATAAGRVIRLPKPEVPAGRRTGVGLRLLSLEEGDRVVCGCTY